MSKIDKLLALIVILLAGLVALIGYGVHKFVENEITPGARTSSNSVVYGDVAEVINLIGTGSVASSTSFSLLGDAQTFFQFPSTADQTYWDTATTSYPHMYGATPTASFLVAGASYMTFEMQYRPANPNSVATCSIFASNDELCQVGFNASNTAEWFPMPLQATTTPADVSGQYATTSIVFDAGVVTKHTFTIKDVNYECARLQCYNASTTDSSYLYANVRIK